MQKTVLHSIVFQKVHFHQRFHGEVQYDIRYIIMKRYIFQNFFSWSEGIREVYEKIRIHRTEISNYEKKQGKCIITFQSAVEHLHYKKKDGTVVSGDENRLEQRSAPCDLCNDFGRNLKAAALKIHIL